MVRAPDPVSTGGPRFNPWCVHTLYCGVTTEVPDRDQVSHVQLLELQQENVCIYFVSNYFKFLSTISERIFTELSQADVK